MNNDFSYINSERCKLVRYRNRIKYFENDEISLEILSLSLKYDLAFLYFNLEK